MKPFTIYLLAVAVLAAAVVLLIFGEVQHSLVNLGVLFVCASALMAIAFYGVYPSRWGNPQNATELSHAITRKFGLDVSNITDWAIDTALGRGLIRHDDPVWKVIEAINKLIASEYDPNVPAFRLYKGDKGKTLAALRQLQKRYRHG